MATILGNVVHEKLIFSNSGYTWVLDKNLFYGSMVGAGEDRWMITNGWVLRGVVLGSTFWCYLQVAFQQTSLVTYIMYTS